jgi:hypothetical protein
MSNDDPRFGQRITPEVETPTINEGMWEVRASSTPGAWAGAIIGVLIALTILIPVTVLFTRGALGLW